MKRLTRVGLPLGLGALVYWAYRLVGVTTVATWFSTEQLGIYAFSARLNDLALKPFADFGSVLMPVLWSAIGRKGSAGNISGDAARVSLVVTAATCAIANLMQAGFGPIVHLVAPGFSSSVAIFEILAFNLVFLTVTKVPGMVLDSATIGRQGLHLAIFTAGLAINVIANVLVVTQGWGMLAIAGNDIWIQALLAILIFGAAQRHLFQSAAQAWALYSRMITLLILCGMLFLLLKWPWLATSGAQETGEFIRVLALRTLMVGTAWLGAGLAMFFHLRSATSQRVEIIEPVGLSDLS
jgi:O-antigen/teichoic acid export membrane protein